MNIIISYILNMFSSLLLLNTYPPSNKLNKPLQNFDENKYFYNTTYKNGKGETITLRHSLRNAILNSYK